MPLTDLDFTDCQQEKCTTPNGTVVDCSEPCQGGAQLDYTTGTCEGDQDCENGQYNQLKVFSYSGTGGFQASGAGFSECAPIPNADGSSECNDLGQVVIECDSTWEWVENETGTDSITASGSCEFVPAQVSVSWTEYVLVITDSAGNESFALSNGSPITYRTGGASDTFLGDGSQKVWQDGVTAEVVRSGSYGGTGDAPYEAVCIPPDTIQCSACN